MIFIRYEDNSYCFICYVQGNIIFCSTYAIFDKEIFSKCTDSLLKEYKSYDKLLDKISPETKLSMPNSSEKDEPAPVSYVKSTHSEDMSLQCCCHYNISDISLSSMMAILLTTYPLQCWCNNSGIQFSTMEILLLNLVFCSKVLLSNLCQSMFYHWDLYLELYIEISEYFLTIWLVYKTSSYTVIH